MLPGVHEDRTPVSFIDKQAFRYTNNTVSDYFQLKTDLLFEETKSGKALASLVAPSPTPLGDPHDVYLMHQLVWYAHFIFTACDWANTILSS